MFIITDPNIVSDIKNGASEFQADNGHLITQGEARAMTGDYMDRLTIFNRHLNNSPIPLNLEEEPVALIYDVKWFRAILDQDPKPAYIRMYFGLINNRHTVLFVGANEGGEDFPSNNGEYYIVEDGTICCPKNKNHGTCAGQLSLFEER